MRYKTTIAILAMAAMAIAAVLSSASASAATVLCEKNESPCAPGNVEPVGTLIGGGVSPAVESSFTLKGGAYTDFHCGGAVITSENTAEAGNPLPAQGSSSISKPSCALHTTPEEQCTSATINNPPQTIAATGGGSGVITLGTEAQPLVISYSCFSKLFGTTMTCSYAGSNVPMQINVAEATITIKDASMARTSGTYCAASAKLNVSGLLTSKPYIATI